MNYEIVNLPAYLIGSASWYLFCTVSSVVPVLVAWIIISLLGLSANPKIYYALFFGFLVYHIVARDEGLMSTLFSRGYIR